MRAKAESCSEIEGHDQSAATIGVLNPIQIRSRLVHYARRKMNPADEPNGSRRERRLIITEERARSRQRYCHLVCVLNLSKISGNSNRSILCSKHAQHESRAVHYGYSHVHIHGIDGCLHNILDIGCLQRLHRRDGRR